MHPAWHLGLTVGATDETKARYGFVFGDFRRLHRTGLISAELPSGRLAELSWPRRERERERERELLQELDAAGEGLAG